MVSDSDSDVTSASVSGSSTHNASDNSRSSSEDGEIRRYQRSLDDIPEADIEADAGGANGDNEEQDVGTTENILNDAQDRMFENILREQDVVSQPPLAEPQPSDEPIHVDMNTAPQDRVNGDDSVAPSESSYEEINCDKCNISSNDFDGQWHQNQAREGEYL